MGPRAWGVSQGARLCGSALKNFDLPLVVKRFETLVDIASEGLVGACRPTGGHRVDSPSDTWRPIGGPACWCDSDDLALGPCLRLSPRDTRSGLGALQRFVLEPRRGLFLAEGGWKRHFCFDLEPGSGRDRSLCLRSLACLHMHRNSRPVRRAGLLSGCHRGLRKRGSCPESESEGAGGCRAREAGGEGRWTGAPSPALPGRLAHLPWCKAHTPVRMPTEGGVERERSPSPG